MTNVQCEKCGDCLRLCGCLKNNIRYKCFFCDHIVNRKYYKDFHLKCYKEFCNNYDDDVKQKFKTYYNLPQ